MSLWPKDITAYAEQDDVDYRKGFGRTVSVTESSLSKWYAPRFHVVLYDEQGHIEEFWQDTSLFESLFIVRYHERNGWTYVA